MTASRRTTGLLVLVALIAGCSSLSAGCSGWTTSGTPGSPGASIGTSASADAASAEQLYGFLGSTLGGQTASARDAATFNGIRQVIVDGGALTVQVGFGDDSDGNYAAHAILGAARQWTRSWVTIEVVGSDGSLLKAKRVGD